VATAGTAAIAALRARKERRFRAELDDMVVLSRRTTGGMRSGAIGGHDSTADRCGGIAHEVDDDAGDRLRRDRMRQQVRGEVGTDLAVSISSGGTAFPDPERAQL